MTDTTLFSRIDEAPSDPILGVTEAFRADKNPNKVNLGMGVYQNNSGKTPKFSAVLEAENLLRELEPLTSYLPIDGLPEFKVATQELLFGEGSEIINSGRAATVQALGGTNGLRLGADFLKRYFPDSEIWISNPSWENHRTIFEAAGFISHPYPYYDSKTNGVDYGNMIGKLDQLTPHSIVLLHACCHNPTGNDLSKDQWREILEICKTKRLIPFLDFAYQGFASGIEEDAFAVRLFASSGIPFLVSSSYSKSFGLYNARIGAMTVVAEESSEVKAITSQLKKIIRMNFSSPPAYGAQIVQKTLSTPTLRTSWESELAEMRNRIKQMRSQFVQNLSGRGLDRDFSFISAQNGMFSYSGLSKEIVSWLRDNKSIYLIDSGRICLAALNEKNIGYVTDGIAEALQRMNVAQVA